MSDLATTLDAQGRFDEACVYVQKASDLARQIEHPELHMLLSNLAAILMHRGRGQWEPAGPAGGKGSLSLCGCEMVAGGRAAFRKLRNSKAGWMC